ncbi:hypothetical protein CUS80_02060 [Enterococcus faecium]|nr:hypothetical protein CUS80_02060 [Enterococcus faecium]
MIFFEIENFFSRAHIKRILLRILLNTFKYFRGIVNSFISMVVAHKNMILHVKNMILHVKNMILHVKNMILHVKNMLFAFV